MKNFANTWESVPKFEKELESVLTLERVWRVKIDKVSERVLNLAEKAKYQA